MIPPTPRRRSPIVGLLGLLVGCATEGSVVGGGRPDGGAADATVDAVAARDVVDVPPAECRADADCSDGVACTVDACRAGRCEHAPSGALCPAGSACDAARGCRPARPCEDDRGCRDDDACTVAERCDVARRVCVYDELSAETPCGAAGSGLACRGGACQCPGGGASLCDGRCADLRSDAVHCGACATACGAGAWCRDGACACPTPQTHCPGVGCVDTAQDLAHCGACGRPCLGTGMRCIEGQCLAPCAAGTHRCGVACVSDAAPASCGSSCAPCPASPHGAATCTAGRCGLACETGYRACNGACVGPTSVDGCGPSCAVCPRPSHGTVACVADACRLTCAPGYHACRGDCVSDASTLSCGASCEPCAVPPHGVATCAAGQCGVACDAGYRACNGTCSDGTSPLACGAACARCAVPANGTATCAGGACGFTCAVGFHACGAACLANASPLSCGASCAPCPVPANGAATCTAGACGFTCDLGFRRVGAACAELPRPLSPPSLATVSVRRPTLRWRQPVGLAGVSVDLCRDRACATVLETVAATATTATPTRDLPAGVVFWRVRGGDEAERSATWSFVVGARSAPVESAWGSLTDVNGDGYGDVVTAATDGRAVLFVGSATGLVTTAAATLAAPAGAGGYGQAVATGDLNGDGYADIIVSAPGADGGRGRVFVYAGGTGPVSAAPFAALAGPATTGGRFGASVAVVGDLDGDGYNDLVVGAPAAAVGGRAYVFRGGAAGPAADASATLSGPTGADSRFGVSVAGAGDLDADGLADVVVGADGVMAEAGRAYVFRGARSGFGAAPWAELQSPVGGQFGQSVAGVGDLDGDGYPDLAVGSPEAEFLGRALVFNGSATGVDPAAGRVLRASSGRFSAFGKAVAPAGDFDGDGYGDLVVGAPGLAPGGGVQLFLGGAAGVATTAAATWIANLGDGSGLGASVSSGRDVDGDGRCEVLFGAEYANTFAGALLIVQGGTLAQAPRLVPIPPMASGYFGHAIASWAPARRAPRGAGG